MEKVCIMGLGYIGLPTASFLATKGFKVHAVDVRTDIVDTINKGKIHIYEPDLDILVKSAVNSGNLRASLEPEDADIFIIAVPTPFKDNHVPDVTYVEAASAAISPYLQPGSLVILESTSPVGTTEKVASIIQNLRPDLIVPRYQEMTNGNGYNKVFVAHCPERVLPGQILRELVENDRIIGGIDKESTIKATKFYQQFIHGKVYQTNSRTAEMAKLTENSFRDVNIAFANELSIICEKLSINVWELIELANRHPRVNILQPGPGVGGHCIAVDPWFIVHSVPEDARLIRTAREVNDGKPSYVVEKIKEKASRFKAPVIGCLGLTFKADIDDVRESPSIKIVRRLAEEKIGSLYVVEPHVTSLPQDLNGFENICLVDIKQTLKCSDLIVLLVDHKVFADIDQSILKEKVVIDTRGMWQ